MMKRNVLVAVVALAVSTGAADAQTRIDKGPIKPTPTTDGKMMFETYCAVCHGKDGTGNGPAAKALVKAPADLSRISARNNGTFPDIRVRRYIEGIDEVAAHGTRDMPMWGELFKSLNRSTAQIRIAVLSEYLKSLQK
jgi:mono/diheme cytochrome c family protein